MPQSKLDKGQIVEIKEFYDGSFGSVRELAQRFNVGNTAIKWLVNHKNYKKEQMERMKKWRKNNPEKWREHGRRAVLKCRLKKRNEAMVAKIEKLIEEVIRYQNSIVYSKEFKESFIKRWIKKFKVEVKI